MSGLVHLARRFLGSLSPRPVASADEIWVREILGDGEHALWERMSLADRKHAAGVARDVQSRLGDPGREVLAAALLHDVGKIESGFGSLGRVGATALRGVVGRETMATWTGLGLRARLGRYVRHDSIGADLLAGAGSHRTTVVWAREHHLDPARWSLPTEVASALAAADDD